jgi:copper chaperone
MFRGLWTHPAGIFLFYATTTNFARNQQWTIPQGGTRVGDMSTTANYLVDGMTCAHCVASVTEELTAVDGVETVTVELHKGGQSVVSVTSAAPIAAADVTAAVTEAGYTLVAS